MSVAVLLSGGVDSSVALRTLTEQGTTDITAFYLKIWLEDEMAYMGDCPWEEDLSYARAVCRDAGVQLEVVPLQLEYYERVVQYAVDELKAGRTPSPDIFCNQRIKFGAFWDRIGAEFTKVATGHYARAVRRGDRVHLGRAPDPVKDQTYFLSHVSQEQMQRVMFPIGDLTKREVRERARDLDLPTKDRKDSQGICFLGKIRYPEFVRHYLGEEQGEIRELETDTVLGPHRGFWFYTIGQRQGLGLGNGPWYVVRKDTRRNIVYVSHEIEARRTARRVLEVGDLTWIDGAPAKERLTCKLRHGPELIGCAIEWLPSHSEGSPVGDLGGQRLRVTLDKPDRGVAPGQFTVFYDGEFCLGGGKILEETGG